MRQSDCISNRSTWNSLMTDRVITHPDKSVSIDEKESDLLFGKYPNGKFDAVFDLEGCDFYQKKLKPNGVATVEFLLRQKGNNHIWLIEAKKTTPKLNQDFKDKLEDFIKSEKDSADFLDKLDKKIKYDFFFYGIKQKFNDSLSLIFSISSERYISSPNYPDTFIASKDTSFILVVVVKQNYQQCEALQNLVQTKLNPIIKTWGLGANCVKVLSEQEAIKKNLIQVN